MTHCRTCIYYGEPEDGLYYKTPLQCLAEPKPYEVKPTRPACRHYKHKFDVPALDGVEGKECQKETDAGYMICPSCKSQNVFTERRLNGDHFCGNCHHKWPQGIGRTTTEKPSILKPDSVIVKNGEPLKFSDGAMFDKKIMAVLGGWVDVPTVEEQRNIYEKVAREYAERLDKMGDHHNALLKLVREKAPDIYVEFCNMEIK
jgi:ribosomal protein L37AE/L43A